MKIEKIVTIYENKLNLNKGVTSKEFNKKIVEYSQKNLYKDQNKLLEKNYLSWKFLIKTASESKNTVKFKVSEIRLLKEGDFLPLKRWSFVWGIPEKFKIRCNKKKRKYLSGLMLPIKNIKHKNLWKQCPTKVFYEKEGQKFWIEIKKWRGPCPPELKNREYYKIKNNKIGLIVPKKYIAIYSKSANKTDFILIKKKFLCGELFWENMGLFYGEMNKSVNGSSYRTFSFVNKRPEIIIHAIKFLHCFDVNKDDLEFQIHINEKFKQRNRIIKFWSKKLEAPKNNFSVILTERKINFPGACNIRYHSAIFKLMMMLLLDLIKKEKLNRNQIIPLTRGLIASEGSIILKNGKIENISFENLDLDIINLFIYCLEALEIKWKVSYTKIFFRKMENYVKCLNHDILKLSAKDNFRFLYGFYNYKEVQDLIKLSKLSTRFTASEYAGKNKIKHSTAALRKLRYLVKKGFVKISGEGTKKSPFIFSINHEFENLLKIVEKIKLKLGKLRIEYPEIWNEIKYLEKVQEENKLKLKPRDVRFINKLEINKWYSLKEIGQSIGYGRGYVTTVMPLLAKKGVATRNMRGNVVKYKIIKKDL